VSMRVRLIGKANGVGLSRDLNLLEAALQQTGCDVTQQPCDRHERHRRRAWLTRVGAQLRHGRARRDAAFDLNVMLEHVWPQFLHQAHGNVLVPNPEWFDRRDAALLPLIDQIWSKTELTQHLFGERGCSTALIGFDSEDRLAAQVPREARFLHLAGRSEMKGTARLLRLWRQHPDWPALTVVQDAAAVKHGPGAGARNILIHSAYIDDAQLRVLQNSHRFHLCLSEAEGWGHYIAEALSVGAVTLTCDAAPMNELVDAQRGVLIAAALGAQQNLARLALFDEAALARAVERCMAMTAEELAAIGTHARRWFVGNKQGFPLRVEQALAPLRKSHPPVPA
jgi:hypothetical protein